MKKIFLVLLSSFLWIFFWIMSFISILLGVLISFFVPKKCYNFIVNSICKTLCYSILFFPKIISKPNRLPYPCIYVANHVSFFDLFISGTILPGNPRGLELKSHFTKPIYGWFISRFGEIPIDNRNTRNLQESLKLAKNILDTKQRNILVMPEGTRTRTGKIGKFHRGAFFLSRLANVPIIPIIYKNLYKHNNPTSLRIIPGKIDVKILDPIYPNTFNSDEEMATFVKNVMEKELNDE